MNLSFEQCKIEQLDVLVHISKCTFIAAFEAHNNPEDFNDYVSAAFSVDSLKVQLQNNNSSFYFAYLNNQRIGYFKLNENDAQNERFDNPSMELERIYVVQEYQGRNLGGLMLQKAIDIAKSKQLDFLWLGVWEKNVKAIRFYERHEFKRFGAHPYFVGKDKQTDILMRLDLV